MRKAKMNGILHDSWLKSRNGKNNRSNRAQGQHPRHQQNCHSH